MPSLTPDIASSSAPNFDRIAGLYRWLEYFSFGPYLQRTRTHFLARFAGCRKALILGDGDGRFSARLLGAHTETRVHAVDGSSAMLRLLTQRVQSAGGQGAGGQDRFTVERADLRHWSPGTGEGYDLIATHFFLDCLTTVEVGDLAPRLRLGAAPDALWVVSEFAIPRTGFGRLIAAPLVALLYMIFHVLTKLRVRRLPDHGAALAAAGWRLREETRFLNGLLISQIWQA